MKKSILMFVITFCFIQSEIYLHAQRADGAELVLKKTFTGDNNDTIHTMKTFPVYKKLKTLIIEISGSVKRGQINFFLSKPNGDNKEFKIDPTTEAEFKQTINLSKMKECVGEWTIIIIATNAVGNYNFLMRTSPF